jgi:hypothetical protein
MWSSLPASDSRCYALPWCARVLQEKQRDGANWRVSRYKELFPDPQGRLAYNYQEGANARSGWNTLMSFDELTQMMTNSVVFAG